MTTHDRRPAHTGSPEPAAGGEDEDRVPLFGSWRAIHLAVIGCAVVVMVLVALFSRWPF